jgi:DNA-binding GntR family transcriptional regulator
MTQLDPISRETLADRVYSLLRVQVLDGELAPGTRLVESGLARMLEVSLAPVREALRRLSHEGLVLQLPHRGSFVAHISAEDARNAYAIRAALEPIAAEGFIESRDEEALATLEGYLIKMHRAGASDDLHGLVEHDAAFHRTVWTNAGNDLLPRIWPLLEASMRNLTLVSNRLYFVTLEHVAQTHDPLLEALRIGDPAAGTMFRDHAMEIWDHVASGE